MNHIAHLIDCLSLGGAQVFMHRVARYAERYRHSVVTCAPGHAPDWFRRAIERTMGRFVIAKRSQLSDAALAEKPDCVVWHHWANGFSDQVTEIQKHAPVIAWCHGMDFAHHTLDVPNVPVDCIIGGIGDLAPGLDLHVEVMPAIVPYAVFEQRSEATEKRQFRVATYARMIERKNALEIIRLWRKVHEETGAELWLYAGPERVRSDYLDDCLREIEQDPSIRLIEDGNPIYYRSSDAFLSWSNGETTALVVAEAMAAGLPVVCRDAWGPKSYVRPGTGQLCDTIESVQEALISLARDAEWANTVGLLAHKEALQFVPMRTVPQYEAVFDKVIADGH